MFRRISIGDLTVYRSDNINTGHLFSTRCGGVSTLPHLVSLNVGENRGDSEENVEENFSRLTRALGGDNSFLVRSRQIHSVNVRTVTKGDKGAFYDDCDGFVTADEGVILCVKVADCAPILLFDEKARVTGALHAGWRGSCSGIALEGVKKMIALGADAGNIKAAIGACIHSCCYQVGQDFALQVRENMGDAAELYLQKDAEPGKFRADIVGMNIYYLKAAGLPEENISVCDECTCHNPRLFFSHRYSKGLRGTMCALIKL